MIFRGKRRAVLAVVILAGTLAAGAVMAGPAGATQSGPSTSTHPTLAVFNNQLNGMWKGTGVDPGLYWATSDGASWSVQQQIGNVGTSEGPALAPFNRQLHGVWKGSGSRPALYWASTLV